ncbi:hypothetical protein J8273_2672 [Carpediemonas membranifera]|uniref:Uncharacterized protein n=1 Tax=Carpediemonas membranifera TaxID=201153 RepID=A0A8J6B0G3_9EUKA|nr:hypothetical protein J8273_2672 [Carpediemonas membranifera]|eukprot:KAG9395760.1 hypothetical protein J8273_2672 [Carpediemonas membranifera]
MPRALEVYSGETAHIARTPKGLWGWGATILVCWGLSHLGSSTRPASPSPAFPRSPSSRPAPWEKHRMVTDVSMKGDQTFILTPVGTVMSGFMALWFTGEVEQDNSHLFHPVAVPTDFVPDHIMHDGGFFSSTVILSMGNRQMISGRNDCGRLGLGHQNEMSRFVDLPYRVDRIVTYEENFAVFLSDRQLLFAGPVTPHIAQSGLLPGHSRGDICLTPTPLQFPERAKGFFFYHDQILRVTEGVTHSFNAWDKLCIAPIEATAFNDHDGRACIEFRDSADQWFSVAKVSDGTAKLVEEEAPSTWKEITPVDVDPTPQ